MALETAIPPSTAPATSPGLLDALKKKAGEEPKKVETCEGCQQVANNQAENKQFRAACQAAGGLSKGQQRLFHMEVTGMGYSYPQLVQIACDIKLNFPGK